MRNARLSLAAVVGCSWCFGSITSVASADTIDSDINITDSAHFPQPGGNGVGFPSPFVPTGQVDTRAGSHAWNAYLPPASGSVWNQAIGLGWGAANPMVGTEGIAGNGQGIFAQKSSTGFAFNTGTNGGTQIVQTNYDLSGMNAASVHATFTVQGQTTGQENGGPALVSLALANNSVNLSIESVYNSNWNIDQTGVMPGVWSDDVGHFIGDGNYYYVLVQHGSRNDNPKALFAIKQWGVGTGPDTQNSTGDFDGGGNPIWENAVLSATNNGDGTDNVTLMWNGEKVFDGKVGKLLAQDNPNTPVLYPLNQASWGNGTFEQRSGASNLMASFQRIHLTGSDVFTPTGTFQYWDINGAVPGAGGGGVPFGNWDGAAQNFNSSFAGASGVITANPGTLDTVVFSGGGDATGTYAVNVSGTRTVAQINFKDGNVTLQGGTLAVGAFDVAAGSSGTIASTLAGGTGGAVVKTGAGTLTLAGANTYTGGTTVSSGTLIVAHGDALGGGAVNIANGATARVQAALPKAVTVSTLTTNASGKFDLTDNSMVVRNMTAPQVQALLQAGYNAGHWNGPTGITSSTAAASTETSIGYASNGVLNLTSFKGVTVLTANDVLVKYTYAGDANLDGKVDIGDLGLLAGAWQQLSGKVWFDGDFTYDGAVNIGDLGLLAGNWQKGVAPGTPLMAFDVAMAQFAAFDGVVAPEPASLALLSAAGAGLLLRRRRRGTPDAE
jgi:autotransporter-associated beta strand protein